MDSNMSKIIESIENTECITEMCKQKPHLILKTQCGVGKYVFTIQCRRKEKQLRCEKFESKSMITHY